MSASKEKKVRASELSAGTNRKQNAADDKAKQEQKFQRGLILAAVIVGILAIAAIIINTGCFGLFYHSLTAVKIGDTTYNAAELNVFYRNAYNSLYASAESSYGEYVGMFVDTSSEEWRQQVYNQTLLNMTDITALYDDAMAHGYTLTEEDRASVDGQLSNAELYASLSGYSTDRYITAMYGRGVNRQTLESVLTKIVVAQSWSNQKLDGLTYTQEQKDSYYAEHADEYDFIDFYYYAIYTDNEVFADLGSDEAKVNAAHTSAEIVAGAVDEDTFTRLAQDFNGDPAPTMQHVQGSNLPTSYTDYSAWLLDSSRSAGDTTVIDSDGVSTALLFVARENNDYRLQNMRHILIEDVSETDEDGSTVYTDEADEAARTRIEEIQAEYEADPTEDHFAELAHEYSEDAGSNENGGLYEDIYRGQMVANIDEFLFDDSRAPGDVAVLSGRNDVYQGWHLVYYVGEGEVYKDYLAENAMQTADYEQYIENLTVPYPASTGAGLRFASLT